MSLADPTHEEIVQALRAWLMAANSLPDTKVVPAETKMVKVPKAYLTVKLSLNDVQTGEDEDVWEISGGGAPTTKARGDRSGIASIQGIGAGSSAYLSTAKQSLRLPSIKALVDSKGLTIEPEGGIQDLSALLDTAFEERFLQEFAISYSRETAPEELVELVTTEVDMTLSSDVAPDYEFTVKEPPT